MVARSTSAHEIVGRQRELADVEAFLEQASRQARTLVIAGEAGIGKTRVWREGVERAHGWEFRVLRSRPGGADVRLAFAGLADLLRDVRDETLDALPAPQRRALAVALMLETGTGAPDELAVAAAFLSIMRELARSTPVLLAVDDVQWLDASTANVLEFALRRLEPERVGVFMTLRLERERAAWPALLGAPDEVRRQVIELQPLSVAGVFEMVCARLGVRLSRSVLLRVHETSAGNPFYALQIARALNDAGAAPAPGAPLPVPPTLRELVMDRLGALSEPARATLLVASALTSPSAGCRRGRDR